MEEPNYTANPSNRCYFCKHELYTLLQRMAAERGFRFVVDGNNLDDTGDYRPGRQAGSELEIRSPLIEAGIAQGRDPGTFQATRPSDLESGGVCLLVLKNSLRFVGYRREAPDDRSRGRGPSRIGISISSACAITAMLRGSRLRAKKCHGPER